MDFVDLAALPHARALAGMILGQAGTRAPLELLLTLINDEEAEVAEGALRSLAAYPERFTSELAAQLLEHIPSLRAWARKTPLLPWRAPALRSPLLRSSLTWQTNAISGDWP